MHCAVSSTIHTKQRFAKGVVDYDIDQRPFSLDTVRIPHTSYVCLPCMDEKSCTYLAEVMGNNRHTPSPRGLTPIPWNLTSSRHMPRNVGTRPILLRRYDMMHLVPGTWYAFFWCVPCSYGTKKAKGSRKSVGDILPIDVESFGSVVARVPCTLLPHTVSPDDNFSCALSTIPSCLSSLVSSQHK